MILLELEKPGTITEVPVGSVCQNARFVFDQPVTLLDGEYIGLEEGQFWYVAGSFVHFLSGKWDRA